MAAEQTKGVKSRAVPLERRKAPIKPSEHTLSQENPMPEEFNENVKGITQSHVDSFNFFHQEVFPLLIQGLESQEFELSDYNMKIWIEEAHLERPSFRGNSVSIPEIWPSECRKRLCSYEGNLKIVIKVQVAGNLFTIERSAGMIPIMVGSSLCYLNGKTPAQLVQMREEPEEMGGYFIINGNEKLVRLLLMPRRGIIHAIQRPTLKNRGRNYTDFGCFVRCIRSDQYSRTIYCHYLNDGTCTVGFTMNKQQFLIPVMLLLKAFIGCSDKVIYDAIVHGDTENTFLIERVESLIRVYQTDVGLDSQVACLSYIGEKFRIVFELNPKLYSDADVARHLFAKVLFVHLDPSDIQGKFDLLIEMVRKVYALVGGQISADNQDALMSQELLLPGQIFAMHLKDLLETYLIEAKRLYRQDERMGRANFDLMEMKYHRTVFSRLAEPGKRIGYLLTTGNMISRGIDLMQVNGFSVVADKLNFLRYLSHFRSVHRGAFFAAMKTTAGRKLLPENWGFLCPVHTPDGAPCGLLNHLARKCVSTCTMEDTRPLIQFLESVGVSNIPFGYLKDDLTVFLDGKIIGHLSPQNAESLAHELRLLKMVPGSPVPATCEVVLIRRTANGQFPGLLLFTTPCRMVRPVINLHTRKIEMIGTLEQVYMNIAVKPEEFIEGATTHVEENVTNFLSIIASCTPFSDFNQSPRNMYQCQMGKQTMGFPMYTLHQRSDNKVYHITTPQVPLVRPQIYDDYHMSAYPTGTNAILAVISYTGYDMDDAMTIHKSSHERGFAAANVYVTKVIDLSGKRESFEKITVVFGGNKAKLDEWGLDVDGLPVVGTRIKAGDVLYSTFDKVTSRTKPEHYKGEDATIIQVALIGNDLIDAPPLVTIKLQYNRNPIIGDKFASRHGQKGILSQLWPSEDMPFSESGIIPDIVFNPHGFPSRMTIGMLFEAMAGKSACLQGISLDAAPFIFNEEDTPAEYFGKQLVSAGYNYYGTERLYSGITGKEFEADIFMGTIYYQRLRHMVSDKYQVRTTGPVNALTRQPVKGRKRAGGIRFGEMERDSLLGHGVSYLLQDRLMNCSDASQTHVCKTCGNFLSVFVEANPLSGSIARCMFCDSTKNIVTVPIPFVFKYLAAELLSMNIKFTFKV